ncbi:hypothetical protein A0H81_08367 [Grifola frondosa]|uniref:Uncharacterized protein n=1 Tax=Grifola frondosa TaxID=5627 RepID=A0A1C7M391_GRIFR|nr:hypothetical protein A0H81_08367 [Grifola frondosa]
MEAKTNDAAYTALKRLDKEGVLKFELSFVVEDLIKVKILRGRIVRRRADFRPVFANTRSVASPNISVVLRELHSDFPSEDPVVRLVLLLTIFLTEPQPIPYSLTASIAISSSLTNYVNSCKEKIDNMHLSPVTRKDMFDVLVSKFVPERFGGILEFARVVMKMGKKDIDGLVTDVALRCLEIGCKGKMLKKLVEAFDFLTEAIGAHVLHHYRLDIDDLPPSDDEKACREFEAPLCRDFVTNRRPTDVVKLDRMGGHTMVVDNVHEQGDVVMEEVAEHMEEVGGEDEAEITESERAEEDDHEDLGPIGQDTLSTMIRKDEMAPRRRRFFELYASYHDSVGKLTYPADPTPVGRWARSHYGHRSAVTAVFMLNAIVNENTAVLQPSFYSESAPTARVPTTLKHFKMLAAWAGHPEEDYLSQEELNGLLPPSSKIRRARVKTEDAVKTESNPTPEPPLAGPSSCPAKSNLRGRKRPRRSTTTIVKSYVVPDSDDEEIADVQDELVQKHAKTRKVESNLQRWIKHLAILLKEEQKKYKEKKKREQASAPPDTKVRVPKTDFHKSLASNLPRLRATDRMKRQQLYGADVPDEDYSEGEEDEYQCRTTRSKRRKVEE